MERYQSIEVLFVGDRRSDAELVLRALNDASRFHLQHVTRLSNPLLELNSRKPQVILADLGFGRPQDMQVLKELTRTASQLPVIGLTDTSDDQLALDAIRNGARECLVKSELMAGNLRRTICHVIERSQMEQSLRENEQKLLAIINTSPLCIKVLNKAGDVQQMNRAGLRMLDADKAEDVLGKCAFDLIAPDHREKFREFHQSICAGGQGRLEFDIISLGGARRHLQTDSVPLHNPEGATLHLAITQDITKRKMDEADLFLRERAMRAVSQGILITDALQYDDPVIYTNPGFEKMTGYTAAEILGRNCRMMQGPDSDRAAVEKMRNAVKARSSCTVEILNYRKDGTTFWNAISIAPIIEENSEVKNMVGIMTDVTEWRELESQFRQAQKMEAIGQLAGSVAHDFNNLLTIIIGSCEEIRTSGSIAAERLDTLEAIEQASQRAAALTRQLLAFSRKQTLNPRVLNLNEILTEILKMASRLLGEDIEVRTRLSPELLRVKIDQGQFEQVILNLIVNARDAMPAGGQLTIETTNVEWSEDDCRLMPQRKPGSYVVLSVGDTGIGISPQDKPRIFEPFFTTKEPSRGTGLGLSVVYGIVQQSEGYIEVDSVPEQGTTFKLYFPAVREHIANAETPVLAKSASVGTETILLVEDDEGVRNIVKLALEKQGYKLLVAGNGPAALTVMETHPGAIHLLLTDLVLPSMSGRQLAKIMIERYPTIKVVYMTGYTEHVMIKHGLPTDAQHMLLKPFSMIELVRIVQLVLSEPQ